VQHYGCHPEIKKEDPADLKDAYVKAKANEILAKVQSVDKSLQDELDNAVKATPVPLDALDHGVKIKEVLNMALTIAQTRAADKFDLAQCEKLKIALNKVSDYSTDLADYTCK
jgi:hypothetical protein